MKEFTFDKETVRAIRRVMGFTTDLRVKLHSSVSNDCDQVFKGICDFIEQNAGGIFGCADMALVYSPVEQEDLYDWKVRNISRLARYVVEGQIERY